MSVHKRRTQKEADVYDRIIGGLARVESQLRTAYPDTEDNAFMHAHIDGIESARLLINNWRKAEVAITEYRKVGGTDE